MADFDWVTDRVATGAAIENKADVEALVSAGVTHVLDARAEYNDALLFATHPGLAYCWNPTADDGAPKPPDYWARTLVFALPMFALPRAKLYCHCACGINRGPSNALCVMVALGWTPDEAEAAIRVVRPQVGLRYKRDAIAACRALGYYS